MTYVVRTAGDPTASVPAIQDVVWNADPLQTFYGVATVDQLLSDTLAARRFTTTLLALFGLAALVLAGLGIYGVIAVATAQRTREIGLRLAMGAAPRHVVGRSVWPAREFCSGSSRRCSSRAPFRVCSSTSLRSTHRRWPPCRSSCCLWRRGPPGCRLDEPPAWTRSWRCVPNRPRCKISGWLRSGRVAIAATGEKALECAFELGHALAQFSHVLGQGRCGELAGNSRTSSKSGRAGVSHGAMSIANSLARGRVCTRSSTFYGARHRGSAPVGHARGAPDPILDDAFTTTLLAAQQPAWSSTSCSGRSTPSTPRTSCGRATRRIGLPRRSRAASGST